MVMMFLHKLDTLYTVPRIDITLDFMKFLGRVSILIATDVASRGLDIKDVT